MTRIREFWRIVVGILHEISDETAYRRHLAAHGVAASGAEWRRFSEERLREKYQRARCC